MKTENDIKNLLKILDKEIDELKNNKEMNPELRTKLIQEHMSDMAVLMWVLDEEKENYYKTGLAMAQAIIPIVNDYIKDNNEIKRRNEE